MKTARDVLQAIKDTSRGRLFNLHHVGQLLLTGAGAAMEPRQRQPLRPGQPELAHAAIENRAHEARHVGRDPAKVMLIRGGGGQFRLQIS